MLSTKARTKRLYLKAQSRIFIRRHISEIFRRRSNRRYRIADNRKTTGRLSNKVHIQIGITLFVHLAEQLRKHILSQILVGIDKQSAGKSS